MNRHRSAKQKRAALEPKIDTPNNHSKIPTPAVRMKSFLVDMFMIGMPVAYLVIYVIMGSGHAFAQDKLLGWGLIFALHAPICLLFLAIKSQTPGMRAYDLTLSSIHSKTKPLFLQVLLRYFLTPISIISIFGVALVFFRKDKMALHDLLSGTQNIYMTSK